MSEAASYPSREQFSSDLRRIRKARGLTLEALHEETKIPLSVLQDFEETGLFDNPMFNRVYLRSFVRTYASYVDIPTKVALEALDEALLDSYRGRLVVECLGEEPPAAETPKPQPSNAEAAKADAPKEDGEPPEAPKPEAAKAEAKKPAKKSAAKAPPKQVPQKTPARTAPTLLTTAEPLPKSQAGRRTRPVDINARASYTQWVLIVGAVFAFAAAIWVVLALLDRPSGVVEQQQAVVVDTTAVDTVTVEPPRPRIVVGDTLDVVVVARQRVERIHIKRDEDARRPYWIEEGVAKAYPVLDRIVIQDKLDRIQLLVEGYAYPTDRLDAQGRLVITRDSVEAFVDTLTTLPVQLSVAPDTIRMFPIR
jgi:hypothetical protein